MSNENVARLPRSEAARLAELASYSILDTEPERQFDDLVLMAKRIFGVPIALLSFVDEDRQFFKAKIGIDSCETDRDGSFCTHVIENDEVLVIPDATLDERFASSPLVSGRHQIRFYAGAPLIAPNGLVLGAFCVKDDRPRHDFTQTNRETLQDFARIVMDRLAARRAIVSGLGSRKQFESIAAVSPDAIICTDGSNTIRFWNRAAETLFGYEAAEALGQSLNIIIPPAMRPMHEAGLARAVAGQPTKLVGAVVAVPACRRDGTEFPIELSLSHWTENGEHRFGAIARDITDRRNAEEMLKREAEIDHLTGIANRKKLTERMSEAAAAGSAAALLLLDLDGFKDVNDSLGHAAGDEVLRRVSTRLLEAAGEETFVSRLGGDEFAILWTGTSDALKAIARGHLLIAAIEQPIEVEERSVYVGASGGVATVDGGDWDPDTLLADADFALYRSKIGGRNRISLFTPESRSISRQRTSVSSGVRQAWEHREFELYYQPQVLLATGACIGAEALIRWNHPQHGVVAPSAFLSTLETSLLAVPVSEWIIETACAQAAEWRRNGACQFRIGVNLFAAQFRSDNLPQLVYRILSKHQLPPDALELEITENIILKDDGRIKAELNSLRAMGVGIAFDDYGTGYASLTMLKEYPVTRLKIDRSFVSGVDISHKDQTIVEAISRLARGFDLEVIAEGIETREQADLMREHCQEGQGYFFGKPVPARTFERELLQQAKVTGSPDQDGPRSLDVSTARSDAA